MKTRLAKTVVVGAIAVAAALVPAGSALAAPADSAVITSATSSEGHFLVRWTLPANAYAQKIEVSRDRAVGTSGEFFPENVVVSDQLGYYASDWTSPNRYPPGTYYVRVLISNSDPDSYTLFDVWSATATLVVPDTTAPRVRALASTGVAGTAAHLRYTLSDPDSLTTHETITISAGGRQVATLTTTPSRIARSGGTYWAGWKYARAGSYRFCVVAADAAGNASAPSCATVTLARRGPYTLSANRLAWKPQWIDVGAGVGIKAVVWSAYGGPRAGGSGRFSLRDCTPSCAAGHVSWVPVSLTLSGSVRCPGGRTAYARSYIHGRALPGGFAFKLGCPISFN